MLSELGIQHPKIFNPPALTHKVNLPVLLCVLVWFVCLFVCLFVSFINLTL